MARAEAADAEGRRARTAQQGIARDQPDELGLAGLDAEALGLGRARPR